MNKIAVSTLIAVACSTGYGAPPDANLVKSCLLAKATSPSITLINLNTNEISREEDYADGFNAIYLLKYRGTDVGYAESKTEQALIYLNKLYRLSKATPLGDNHGVKPGAFDPTLAQWSTAREGQQKFFCVSFNFSGLGQSGSFQNIHGGYLLNAQTKDIYFFVRDVRQ